MLDNTNPIPETIANGLTENTRQVFEQISKMECIKDLYLCGGTAQAIMMNHRLSEDLDFELISRKRDKPQMDAGGIITEVKRLYPQARLEMLGDEHFQLFVGDGNSVKLSFFSPANPVKTLNVGLKYNNIKTPTKQELLGMKVFTTSVRFVFRDYYDIYCLLKDGQSWEEAVSYASYLSNREYKSRQMIANLLSPNLFIKDSGFALMNPTEEITAEGIRDFLLTILGR